MQDNRQFNRIESEIYRILSIKDIEQCAKMISDLFLAEMTRPVIPKTEDGRVKVDGMILHWEKILRPEIIRKRFAVRTNGSTCDGNESEGNQNLGARNPR